MGLKWESISHGIDTVTLFRCLGLCVAGFTPAREALLLDFRELNG